MPSQKPTRPPKILIFDPFFIQPKLTPIPEHYDFIIQNKNFPLKSEPFLELPRDLIYIDLERIYSMKEGLIMPQEVVRATKELKLRFGTALEQLKDLTITKHKEELIVLILKFGEASERVALKLLANEPYVEKQASEEVILSKHEEKNATVGEVIEEITSPTIIMLSNML
ncbi:hypothetical protein QL285_051225 [Trifolium repens]|nr:hypothetical protein QL285_051225 [Trifolium repens]